MNNDTEETEPQIPIGAATLRDWFASNALVGLLLSAHGRDACPRCAGCLSLTAHAYTLADAMLAERAKGGAR